MQGENPNLDFSASDETEDASTELCPHCHDYPCRCLREQEEREDFLDYGEEGE